MEALENVFFPQALKKVTKGLRINSTGQEMEEKAGLHHILIKWDHSGIYRSHHSV